MNITEDKLLEINRRWKAVRAKARDEGCTEAERRAFALKAKEIKSEVHERLQGKETDEVLFSGAREPARTKPAMIDWIGGNGSQQMPLCCSCSGRWRCSR